MVRDLLKISSDDSYITSQHILFMLEKFRAYVLKTKYENKEADIPDTDKSSMTIELELVEDNKCSDDIILESIPRHNKDWWCKVEGGYIVNLKGERKNKIPYDYNS